MSALGWGFGPESWEAGATVVATLFAGVAGWYAFRAFRQMRIQSEQAQKQVEEARKQTAAVQEQLDRDRERELRAHAETISVWTEHDTARDAVVLREHNSSQIAAHDLRAALVLGTQRSPELFYAHDAISTIPPTAPDRPLTFDVSDGCAAAWAKWMRKQRINFTPRVEFIFTDTAGTAWVRDATGRLRRFESDCGHAKEWKKGSGRPLCTCGDGARTPAE